MDAESLIEQAEQFPACLQKIILLEQAAHQYELAGRWTRAFETRRRATDAAEDAGLFERAAVSFAKCLHMVDTKPELEEDAEDLLWDFFHVIWFSADEPAIPLEKILEMLEDLRRRFDLHGLNPRPVAHLRWRIWMRIGRMEQAQKEWEIWRNQSSTWFCYDQASQQDSTVDLLFRCGRYEESLQAAEPILKGELKSEPEIPFVTYCYVMMCHLHLGQLEKAKRYHQKGYRLLMAEKRPLSLYEASFHLVYLVHVRELAKALDTFERYLPWAVESTNKDNHCLFFNAAGGLFNTIEDDQPLSIRTPRDFRWRQENDQYTAHVLGRRLTEEADAIAARFDARNQTTVYSELMHFFRNLCAHPAET